MSHHINTTTKLTALAFRLHRVDTVVQGRTWPFEGTMIGELLKLSAASRGLYITKGLFVTVITSRRDLGGWIQYWNSKRK